MGRLLSGYLHAFGCNVVAFDPYLKEDTVDQVSILSLPELLRTSDIVCLCVRLTEENYHLIGKKQLPLVKKEAVLVNTARSGLIDQKSLVEALKERKIRGPALDIFDMEPLPADDELLRLENVTITSHLAGSTREAFTNSPKLMASVIEGLLSVNGNQLPVVNGINPVL